MTDLLRRIETIVAPTIVGMGYELVRVAMSGGGTLQIMVEPADGRSMDVEGCATLSRALSAVLDVEDRVRVETRPRERRPEQPQRLAERRGRRVELRPQVGGDRIPPARTAIEGQPGDEGDGLASAEPNRTAGDAQVQVAGDVAFDHHLTHVRGTSQSGQLVDMWFRETVGYRRVGGRWQVTHQHSSVPFDMANGRAMVDLKPD